MDLIKQGVLLPEEEDMRRAEHFPDNDWLDNCQFVGIVGLKTLFNLLKEIDKAKLRGLSSHSWVQQDTEIWNHLRDMWAMGV